MQGRELTNICQRIGKQRPTPSSKLCLLPLDSLKTYNYFDEYKFLKCPQTALNPFSKLLTSLFYQYFVQNPFLHINSIFFWVSSTVDLKDIFFKHFGDFGLRGTVPFRPVRTVTGHRDFGLSEMSQMSQVTGRLAKSTRIVVTNAKNASFCCLSEQEKQKKNLSHQK